ncbi:FtsX-like permease family protein [Betaproteobacteria bacterium]|nr:FtsX-like permease family protein [Betaproteobacteria bacterium]
MSIQSFLFLLYHFSAGVFRKHKLKWTLTILALAASVSLITAVEVINKSAINQMARSANLLNGFADINLVSLNGEFEEELFNKLASVKNELGIAAASPVLSYQNWSGSLDKKFQVLGVDIFRAAGTTPVFFQGIRHLSDQGVATEDNESFINLLSENSAIISSDIFDDLSLSDKKLHLNTRFGVKSLIPIAVSQSKHLSNVVIMDIGNLQTILKKSKTLSRIDIRLEADSNLKKTKIALLKFLQANQLDKQIRILDSQSREKEISQLSSAYRGNLFVLGIATLFVTFFLLYAIVDLSLQQQRKNLELMNQIGGRDIQLFQLVLSQNILFTSVASVIGVLSGILIAIIFGKELGDIQGEGLIFQGFTDVNLTYVNLFSYWTLGVISGILATIIIFFKLNLFQTKIKLFKSKKVYTIFGGKSGFIILLFLVGIFTSMEPIQGIAVGPYLGIFFLLLTPIVFLPSFIPVVAKKVVNFCPSFISTKGWLMLAFYRLSSDSRLDSNVVRTIIASLSLTIAMVIMVHSFRDSLIMWLDKVLESDCYISVGKNLSKDDISYIYTALESNEAVDNFELVRVSRVSFKNSFSSVPVILKQFFYKDTFSTLPMVSTDPRSIDMYIRNNNNQGQLYLYASEGFLARYNLNLYDTFDLNFKEGSFKAFVLGRYRDYGRQHGSLTVSTAEYPALSEYGEISHYAIDLQEGKRIQEFKDGFEAKIGDRISFKISDNTNIKKLSLLIFDKTFSITYVLFLVSLFVCIFSVACSCSSQIESREQELKLMKKIGHQNNLILKQILSEQAFVGLISIISSVFVGILISIILIAKVNPQTFFWTLDFEFPLKDILLIVLLAFTSILISTFAYFAYFKKRNLY